MKIMPHPTVAAIALALCLILFPGCNGQPSPMQTYATLQNIYNDALLESIQARQLDLIDAETWRDVVLPLAESGNRLLDQMKVAAEQGNRPAIDVYAAELRIIIAHMLAIERNTE